MKINHDAHMHTFLSNCCHDEKHIPVNILKKASQMGIKKLCFTDHMWAKEMIGADDWYATQDYDHVMQIRSMIPKDTFGVTVLIGCETEYLGDGLIGISRETASKFDFVLAPTNHTLTNYLERKGIMDSREIAKDLIQRFKDVLSFDVASGIAHPFLPLGYFERGDEILSYLSEEELNECFSMANEKKVSIELNTDTFASNWNRFTDKFTDEAFLRIFEIAKKAKCKFHFGSDAHSLEDMDLLPKMQRFVDWLKIEEEDINELFR